MDFKKRLIRNKEDHYVMVKGVNPTRGYLKFANVYTSYIKAPKYIKQILTHLKGETDNYIVTVENFSILLPLRDRSCRQKKIRKHRT